MPLNLSENFKKKFIGGVRSRLPNVIIEDNYRVDLSTPNPFDDFDKNLPIDSAISQEVRNFISETPLRDFCLDWLFHEFHPRNMIEGVDPIFLKDIDGIRNFENIAEEMWGDFVNLPHSYNLYYPLPERMSGIIPSEVDALEIPRGIRIVRWNNDLAKLHPEVFLAEFELERFRREILAAEKKENGRKRDFLCLEVKCGGYFDWFSQTNSNHNYLDCVRSLFGILYALRHLSHSIYGQVRPSGAIFKYKTENKTMIYDGITPLRGGILTTVSQLSAAYDVDRGLAHYGDVVSKLNVVFSSSRSERILLAARWLFDSLVGEKAAIVLRPINNLP